MLLGVGSEIPCPEQTASSGGARHWVPLPGPTRPGSHAVWPPPARAVSRKGFRISCVGTEAALSRWGPEAAVGPRGHVARRPRCQRPPAPRPTWGRFKGGRRISQPRAQRPAGYLGTSQGGTVSAQRRRGAAGASAPTLSTRRQPLKPTPQAGSPSLPRKGRGPGLLPASPRHLEDDHKISPENALEPGKSLRTG